MRLCLQLYKHLANGEGGNVPDGGVALLRDPEALGQPLVERGVRICCPNDRPLRPSVPTSLPDVVAQNIDAYFRARHFSRGQWAATRSAFARVDGDVEGGSADASSDGSGRGAGPSGLRDRRSAIRPRTAAHFLRASVGAGGVGSGRIGRMEEWEG